MNDSEDLLYIQILDQYTSCKEYYNFIEQDYNQKLNEDESNWNIALSENLSSSYLAYLKMFPNGIYIKEAKEKFDEEKLIEEGLKNLLIWSEKNKLIDIFPQDFKGMKTLTKLTISNSSIETLSTDIGYLINLEELRLTGNEELISLPKNIINSNKLSKFIIEGSLKITDLPDSLWELPNLSELTISGTHVKNIPSNIEKLTNIKYLDISGNRLTTLPNELTELKNLRYLSIGGNYFKKLPTCIKNLSNLKKLIIRGSMFAELGVSVQLKELPSWICSLSNLTYLDISENKLVKLPRDMGNLINLEELNVSYNNINKLPNSMKKLKNLMLLNIKDNILLTLPEWINDLDNLKNIDEIKNIILDINNWINAKKENTPASYTKYIDKNITGSYIEKAKENINDILINEEKYWINVKEKNIKSLYKNYLDTYINGKYLNEAKEAISTFEAKLTNFNGYTIHKESFITQPPKEIGSIVAYENKNKNILIWFLIFFPLTVLMFTVPISLVIAFLIWIFSSESYGAIFLYTLLPTSLIGAYILFLTNKDDYLSEAYYIGKKGICIIYYTKIFSKVFYGTTDFVRFNKISSFHERKNKYESYHFYENNDTSKHIRGDDEFHIKSRNFYTNGDILDDS